MSGLVIQKVDAVLSDGIRICFELWPDVPAADRLKQLKTNLSRLTEMAGVVKAHRKYVIVNIPAAQVESVALNKVITRHTGVVGKVDRPTPLLPIDQPPQSRFAGPLKPFLTASVMSKFYRSMPECRKNYRFRTKATCTSYR